MSSPTSSASEAPAEVHLVHAGASSYRMCLPQAATDYIQKKIADSHEPYEREMLEDIAARVSPGDLVVDVGANVGNHSIYLAAVAGCRVAAFEPNPSLCDAIRASAALNGLQDRVAVHAIGLGRADALARFDEAKPENLGAQKLALGEGEIEVRRLDALGLPGPVKVLKIDVEGMEVDVLEGAAALVARDRPMLYIECISDKAFRAVAGWLESRHYVCWETFNATPTHLFRPVETIALDDRLSRLQAKLFHETYRTGLLLTSVRSRLTSAYEADKKSRAELARLESEHAVLKARLADAHQELEATRARHEDLLAELRALTRAGEAQQARAVELAQQLGQAQAQLTDARAALERETAAARQLAIRLDEARAATAAAIEARQRAEQESRDASHQRDAALGERDRALAEAAAAQAQRAAAAADRDAAQARRDAAEVERHAAWAARDAAHAERDAARAERDAARADRARALSERTAARTAAARAAAELQQHRERSKRLVEDQRRLRTLVLERGEALDQAEAQRQALLAGARYRVGAALIDAVRSPRGLARLPKALWQIVRDRGRAPAAGAAAAGLPAGPVPAKAARPPLPAPAPTADRPAPPATPRQDVAVLPPARRPKRHAWRAGVAPAALRVAAFASSEATSVFAGECAWQSCSLGELARGLPPADLLLIEAAHLADAIAERPAAAADIAAALARADSEGLATVLWCDAGPDVRHDYLAWAAAVDWVLVEDLDAVAILRRCLAHDQVLLWPAAFQPRRDNPYHAGDGEMPAGEDEDSRRLAARIGEAVAWVEVPDPQSQSRVPAALLRRLARGQLPLSGYSRAMHLVWGDLVITSDSADQRSRRADQLAACAPRPTARAQRALRKLMDEHTAARRLATLASALGGADAAAAAAPARLAVVAEVASPADVAAVVEAFERQTAPAAALFLLGRGGEPLPDGPDVARVHRVPDRAALVRSLDGFDQVAVMDPRDHYGPEYLADLALALQLSGAQACTKAAHFAATGGARPELVDADARWRLGVGRAVARASLFAADQARRLLDRADGAVPLGELVADEGGIASADEFSYCRGGAGLAPDVDVPAGSLWAGVPLAALEQASRRPLEGDAPSFDPAPGLAIDAAEWCAWLPAKLPEGVALRPVDGGVEVQAQVAAGVVQYVYLERSFTPAQLKAGRETLMSVEANVRGDVRAVLVFYDAKGRKISHVMRGVGTTGPMSVPDGTAHARLALRFQAGASGTLGRIVLAAPKLPPRASVPSAPVLLIGKQYPGYDDLYRFGFVHSRVRGYRAEGTRVDVFRLTQDPRGLMREFEDVPVDEGDAQRLAQAIAHGGYQALLVHFMDRSMWQVLQSQLDRCRVIVWVHGAEIQPWWRRAINHETDAQRDQARRSSDERLAMWREVLGTQHPNLTLVFVSAKQAAEAFSDLGLVPDPRHYRVISNFIDGGLFAYREKPAEQRRRILSIRPYASAVYANDLMVDAIVKLSDEPVFPQLSFRVIGDGVLFERTVEPLRAFPNVTIERRFLTQHQIAELHRDYGIFLVPSRMDTQGVSRDEAMASGLVPITTRIAAIPEFVDPSCAFLAEPEDSDGLARAVLALQDDPERFLAMSAAAARAVRARSGADQTIRRELALVRADEARPAGAGLAMPSRHIAVYGDLNLNIMDGSAIWAASLSETLASLPGVGVTLLFKARIHRTAVFSRLLDLTPRVRLVEPAFTDRQATLDVDAALDRLASLDDEQAFIGFVLRGFDLCTAAAARPRFQGRLWAYLTDIPQSAEEVTPDSRERIARILEACRFLLCQTPQFRDFVLTHWPQVAGKTVLLPPMIPPRREAPRRRHRGGPFRICYAGKFAPRWGIRDMLRSFGLLRQRLADAELHVYGDKIHHVKDEPGFREEIRQGLTSTPGLTWHGAVDRDVLMQAVSSMDAAWAFRDPEFEAATHELSTKVLEYASAGVPVVLARSEVNESVLGADYPLFARDAEQATGLLARLADDEAFAQAVSQRLERVADAYSFEAVGRLLREQGILD